MARDWVIITPRACAMDKIIRSVVCCRHYTKIARSRDLGIIVSYKYRIGVENVENLPPFASRLRHLITATSTVFCQPPHLVMPCATSTVHAQAQCRYE